jgi:hypothetical protein
LLRTIWRALAKRNVLVDRCANSTPGRRIAPTPASGLDPTFGE